MVGIAAGIPQRSYLTGARVAITTKEVSSKKSIIFSSLPLSLPP